MSGLRSVEVVGGSVCAFQLQYVTTPCNGHHKRVGYLLFRRIDHDATLHWKSLKLAFQQVHHLNK